MASSHLDIKKTGNFRNLHPGGVVCIIGVNMLTRLTDYRSAVFSGVRLVMIVRSSHFEPTLGIAGAERESSPVYHSWTDTAQAVFTTIYFYWSSLEAGLAIIAACLPSLVYILRRPSKEVTGRKVSYVCKFKQGQKGDKLRLRTYTMRSVGGAVDTAYDSHDSKPALVTHGQLAGPVDHEYPLPTHTGLRMAKSETSMYA